MRVCQSRRIRHECFCDGSLPGDFSPREWCRREINNKAEKGEQQNDTTRPNWHFRFRAARFNIYLFSFCFVFFFTFFFFLFRFFLFLRNFILAHVQSTSLQRGPASLTWNEKWKAWRSFSFAIGAFVLFLPSFLFLCFFFFTAAYVASRRMLHDYLAYVVIVRRFCRFRYYAKGPKDNGREEFSALVSTRISYYALFVLRLLPSRKHRRRNNLFHTRRDWFRKLRVRSRGIRNLEDGASTNVRRTCARKSINSVTISSLTVDP